MKYITQLLLLTFCIATSSSHATEALSELIKSGKYDQAREQAKNNNKHYLYTLIKQANDQKLYEDKKWHMLMHYKSNLFGSYTSEVDGEDFFISETGKNDPQAELEATLASFFSNQPSKYAKLTSQCRFIARFYWLNQQLLFDTKKLPPQACPKFKDFKKGVNADAITMIFPSAHPNGPASMFGHTSLKIDKKNRTKKTRMLDYTLNFAAMAGPDRGFSYAIKGLTGSFKGQYSILPYYSKIREYAQMESRDIWEYTLDLSESQIDYIVMHAYELSPTYYDYYFFTENCSYHLMTLVESAMDSSLLTDEFNGWVIPVDTLKAIDTNNLIKKVQFLPSLSTKILHRRKQLSDTENSLAYNLLEHGLDNYESQLQALPVKRQAMVLDLLYEYMRYKKIDDSDKLSTGISKEERSVLLARSKLHIPSEPLNIPTPDKRPDQGHDTSRFSLENIKANNKPSFQRIAWRSAYHGLLDSSSGYTPNYQLEFFNLKLSNEENPDSLKFDQLELLNIISLAPRDDLFKKPSWKFKTGWDRIIRTTNESDTIYYFDVSLGLTYKKNWFKHSFLYGFLDFEFDFDDNRYNKPVAGIGSTVGMLTDVNDIWKFQLQLRSLTQNDPMHSRYNEISLSQNIALSKNISLKFTGKKTSNSTTSIDQEEINVSLNFFH